MDWSVEGNGLGLYVASAVGKKLNANVLLTESMLLSHYNIPLLAFYAEHNKKVEQVFQGTEAAELLLEYDRLNTSTQLSSVEIEHSIVQEVVSKQHEWIPPMLQIKNEIFMPTYRVSFRVEFYD